MRTLFPCPVNTRAPVIKNLVTAPVPTDKVERHLAERAVVREVSHAVNAWAYGEG
jgi:hypothetical protein